MTLNNAQQDPSIVRQCLGYALFAKAGLVAPRCNFAHVKVNGTDLGVYAHVEAIDKDLLRRRFDKAGGNLYEGTLSDFNPTFERTFDLKNTVVDRSDLAAVTAALTAPDAELLARLEPLVDVTSSSTSGRSRRCYATGTATRATPTTSSSTASRPPRSSSSSPGAPTRSSARAWRRWTTPTACCSAVS